MLYSQSLLMEGQLCNFLLNYTLLELCLLEELAIMGEYILDHYV